jgi:regulatory protein
MTLKPGSATRPRRAPSASLDEDAAEALAQRLLATSDRSRADLSRRLVRAGATPELASRVVARAASLGWVDDARVADSLARRSLERGYGSRRLLADLRGRGVDREVVEGAMRAVAARQEEAVRRAAEHLIGRRPAGPMEPGEARRLAAALLRRGFGSGEVRDLVRRLARGEGA